jgi:hypothetical protein
VDGETFDWEALRYFSAWSKFRSMKSQVIILVVVALLLRVTQFFFVSCQDFCSHTNIFTFEGGIFIFFY